MGFFLRGGCFFVGEGADEPTKHGWVDATTSHHSEHFWGGARGGMRQWCIIADRRVRMGVRQGGC